MTRELWDAEAAHFDEEADHGLTDPAVRTAWIDLLRSALPATPGRVADLGCGTGTLARLLTDEGYTVDGLDLSPEMIKRARAKVPEAHFGIGDANKPSMQAGAYDIVLCRHVLWAMDEPEEAFARWVALLQPGGIVVLIEGRWAAGTGITSEQMEQIVLSNRTEIEITHLPQSIYWGKDITDERYLAVSHR